MKKKEGKTSERKTPSKVVVICGATATGKSALAVELACELARVANGKTACEIISADSRQMYRGLNIGTGKITRREMRGIPHHLLDVADPKRRFSVEEFQRMAREKIAEIAARGHVPILCGGTGFYIQAVVDDLILPSVPPNIALRKKLERKSATELFIMLKKLDLRRAATIDAQNPRRLVRAIEIATAIGKVPSRTSGKIATPYDTLFIGITMPDDLLKEKIRERLISRLKKGMIAEAKRLHGSSNSKRAVQGASLSWRRMNELGLEYRYLALYLQKKPPCLTREELIEKLSTEIWHYARRQKTWFKRDNRIKWFTLGKNAAANKKQKNKIAALAKNFLKKSE